MAIGALGKFIDWGKQNHHVYLQASCMWSSIYSVSSYRIMGLRELQSISTVTAEFYHSCNRNIAPTAPMPTAFSKTTLVSVCTRNYKQMQDVENHFSWLLRKNTK